MGTKGMSQLTQEQQQQYQQQVQDIRTKYARTAKFANYFMSNGQIGTYSCFQLDLTRIEFKIQQDQKDVKGGTNIAYHLKRYYRLFTPALVLFSTQAYNPVLLQKGRDAVIAILNLQRMFDLGLEPEGGQLEEQINKTRAMCKLSKISGLMIVLSCFQQLDDPNYREVLDPNPNNIVLSIEANEKWDEEQVPTQED